MADEERNTTDFCEDKDVTYQWQTSVQFQEKNTPALVESNIHDNFKILDPDDPLMKRFQNALKKYLIRTDNKLSDEIKELEIAVKENNKTREDEGVILYNIQQEAAEQHAAIENYTHMLAEIINLRADTEEHLKQAKETHRKVNEELESKKLKEKNLIQTIESFSILQQQFSKWESELAGNLTISQRISEKDAAHERELLYQKQQKDYVLYKLEDEIWNLQSEIKDLDEQLQMKDLEKINLSQAIADANADLQGLEKEHQILYNAWNNVLILIGQRDKINDEITAEQRKIRDSLQNLQMQIEKIKKDSLKEMENNEYLTSIQLRINDDIKFIKKHYEADKEKFLNLESNFVRISKLMKQNEQEYSILSSEYKSIINEEKLLEKEIMKFDKQKHDVEENILTKLDDKVTQDNTIKYFNKLLHEIKDSNVETELNLSRLENTHGKHLLEWEKLNSLKENDKFDLDAMVQKNLEKQKEVDKLINDQKNFELLFKQKERKFGVLSKKIEELLSMTDSEEASPVDIKIVSTEKNIDEIEGKIKKAQQIWLRQQGYIFSLSEQRDLLMRELNIINKEIMLLEQKNFKLGHELEKQNKEEANINRTINGLQYKLIQINLKLASQKELKNELQDKNAAVKNEYVNSLKDAEMELIKLQTDIKLLLNEKDVLKDDLKAAQQESLSWEKKVQLVNEINKACKEKKSASGDIGIMKSEIHKMEIRLSYLQKAQEKLVQDMEFCISRRENITDEAIAKENRNPKNQHNQRIVLRKRLDDQKTKIKNLKKETKQIENKIKNLEDEQAKLLEYLNEGQKLLRQNEDVIPDIDEQLKEAEMIKHHNLEVLVRKQRKVNMFRNVKNNQYKLLIKSETALDEEWKKQQDLQNHLNEIMLQAQQDFPMLKNEVRKILLSLQNE